MDAITVDPGRIRALFYGGDWHTITAGSARVDPVWFDGAETSYAEDWITYVNEGGAYTNRIRLSAVVGIACANYPDEKVTDHA